MSKLTSAQRGAMPSSMFGMPGERKYPMPDASHAANAKSRAAQQHNAGHMSTTQMEAIDRKADRMMGKKESPMEDRHEAGHMPKGRGFVPGGGAKLKAKRR